MNVLLLVAFICLSNLACMIVGARIGQKVQRGEEIKIPDPVEKVQTIREEREHRKEQEALDTMLYNIDVYDGTSLGQRDIRV